MITMSIMLERNLNAIIKRSFDLQENSCCCKIPDGQKGQSIQLPFDLFGMYHGIPLYCESKLIKSNLNAFALNKIELHQYDSLHFYSTKSICKNLCIYSIGYYVPRSLKIVFFFDSEFIYNEFQSGIKSFKKQQMTNWHEKELFLPINYTTIDDKRVEVISNLERLEEKIIYGY